MEIIQLNQPGRSEVIRCNGNLPEEGFVERLRQLRRKDFRSPLPAPFGRRFNAGIDCRQTDLPTCRTCKSFVNLHFYLSGRHQPEDVITRLTPHFPTSIHSIDHQLNNKGI
jgi:hypothetical protein